MESTVSKEDLALFKKHILESIIGSLSEDCGIINATCSPNEVLGDFVYIEEARTGALYKVRRADPYNKGKMPCIGMIAEKTSDTSCYVRTRGKENCFNELTVQSTYFLGADGKASKTPPKPEMGRDCFVQPVGIAFDSTVLDINPSRNIVKRTLD